MPELSTLERQLDKVGFAVSKLEGRRDELVKSRDFAVSTLAGNTQSAYELEATLAYLQTMEKEWRDRFQEGLSSVVSNGLSSVFQKDIKVLLETTTFRDATSIDLVIEQDGLPRDVKGTGGSLRQVLSFLLRVLMLVSARPSLHSTMVLDEPFGMVSRNLRPRLCALIQELNARLGIQFVIVSHEPELADCGSLVYEVYWKDSAARARVLKSGAEEALL